MEKLGKILRILVVGALCFALGGAGAAFAVTEVPAVRAALQGPAGQRGGTGPAGPPGPQGIPGVGISALSGTYVITSFGCPAGTHSDLSQVVVDVTLDPEVRSALDGYVLQNASLRTKKMNLCEIP